MAEDKKKNPLFEILNALFMNKDYITNLTKETMKQNCFMINRRIAIQYPLQAQVFNHTKANPADVIKFWSEFLYTGSRPPGWIYTAGAAKSQAKKDSKREISQVLIREYCNHYHYSMKDVEAAMRFFPEETIAEIKDFETFNKQIKSYEENNN